MWVHSASAVVSVLGRLDWSEANRLQFVINHQLDGLCELNRVWETDVGLERCVVDPVRFDEEQPRIAHGAVGFVGQTTGVGSRRKDFGAQRFGDGAFLSLPGMEARDDEEFFALSAVLLHADGCSRMPLD